MSEDDYCLIDATRPPKAEGPPYADCVLCREPTEYPESYKGITLCPVCWGSPRSSEAESGGGRRPADGLLGVTLAQVGRLDA
ncbi:hypothetical protein [Streptomyces sp. NL15-2K]|uniref:hypothetical protein n=1 Tax=Streptomyces sp. NL15-2K TaxID=376149 RepID=UPI000F57B83E|nr:MULTISPECIES: hypothetical protein [Actinomycetes]WKX13377.1 hypothetical protein Q4V64_39990 [Kutzneria buriramensis]GCB45250.1 hypothetical protein SNL152K_2540 [Streptomyces sp. NL15-2K]